MAKKAKQRKCLYCGRVLGKNVNSRRKRHPACAKKHAATQCNEYRRRAMKDPRYRKQINAYFLKWRNNKMKTDPDFKARREAALAKSAQKHKKRMKTDPVYKNHIRELHVAWEQKRKAEKKHEKDIAD